MSTSFPTLFNQAANKAGFAAVYPAPMPPQFKTLTPGTFGTFVNGVFSPLGTIFDTFGAPQQQISSADYTGRLTWHSSSFRTVQGSIGASGVFADDGFGEANSAIQFSSSDSTLFSVSSLGTQSYTLTDPSVFGAESSITTRVETYPHYGNLRFVGTLYTATRYRAWGGQNKNASLIITGSAEACTDEEGGKFNAAISIASSNVETLNVTAIETNAPIPIAMQLYALSSHSKQWVLDNAST